jgi:hypothetical protein
LYYIDDDLYPFNKSSAERGKLGAAALNGLWPSSGDI